MSCAAPIKKADPGDYGGMKTAITPAVPGPASREPRRYSLLETAQLLGLSLAALHDLLVRHQLHAEAGRRGSCVSQDQILHYIARRESSAPAGVNLFMRFGSKR